MPYAHIKLTAKLPSEEIRDANVAGDGLSSLNGYVEDFKYALTLFDFCKYQSTKAYEALSKNRDDENAQKIADMFNPWPFVPARDGAMTIYHFVTALRGIEKSYRKCPTLIPMVDSVHLKNANKKIETLFPAYAAIRHAVAHVADKTKTTEKLDEHAFTGSYSAHGLDIYECGQATITNNLFGRNFTNSWDGKILSYEISKSSLDNLELIKTDVWNAFTKAYSFS